MTREEEEFPIAFSLVVYKDVEMVERLLRAIYRPQNYYCIHVDAKSKKEFLFAMSSIAQCFANVFLSTERVDVKWGQYTNLEPELICMKQLWRYRKWKYFINLTGQEFPLKTNAQLVKILHAFNGANGIDGTIKRANLERWPTKPPRGLRPVKGAVHIIANRFFVDYILHNETAKDLIEWLKSTKHPDETLFSTLNYNPQLGIPGTYKGGAESDESLSNQREFFKGCAKSIENLAEMFRVEEANCKAIFSGNKDDVDEGVHKANVTKRSLKSNGYYLNLTENCDVFKNARGYVTCPMTREEEEFPIAFSLVVYKDVEMVERLLRAIYRPQNYYCIHIDAKSDQDFFLAISGIAECFTNVFVSTQRVDVQWGEFSVLEPELLCMKQLWRYTKWKYFINLTGQEFPLKTNAQLVKILKAYNGANDVESTVKRRNPERWPTTPPRDFRPVKGASHITVNRDFVDYLLHNKTSIDLLTWVKDQDYPDETFFATLNHNPQLGISGTFIGEPETNHETKPFLSRFKNWGSECLLTWKNETDTSKEMRLNVALCREICQSICILTTGDLPLLYTVPHLFANKFYLSEDLLAVGCLEEKLMNDTRDEFLGVKTFNVSYYESVGFVKNKVE
ncbi:LOW QUALITY PROTEIN: beta-1,3-galactosyl-O-glycosyl-glycoprotein beta-1,6-N-acetylglucosaminyltransferase-like [Physella acuta]|uniref:LOW QUALITY PROTEIN: beta-1,3-galactosyl-O-glycosyl-glycoprotein beta-1,6-N-acetylglucosaminyltransferase-like n=1 Tax=Physella acuta TaxID=109671 RepID=UPI0027DAB81F|nr:LOW QUALITY PROTEIN: beta-1,3-galactosyl-O-glycosyl-glycoprotein beta-1,6-N-acetylglucosaminyltransferase-like [Physella acuta]